MSVKNEHVCLAFFSVQLYIKVMKYTFRRTFQVFFLPHMPDSAWHG